MGVNLAVTVASGCIRRSGGGYNLLGGLLKKRGYPFGCPHEKDDGILGPILGLRDLRKMPYPSCKSLTRDPSPVTGLEFRVCT